MKLNLTLSNKILIPFILINLITSLIFSVYLYQTQKKTFIKGIDNRLTASAQGTSLASDAFHDLLTDPETIDPDAHEKLQNKLTEYAHNVGVKFVYTTIMKDNQIVFTLSSYTKEEKEKGVVNELFDTYEDASDGLKEAFRDGKVHFEEYTDSWGTFRSVFIPCKSPNGTSYIVGADFPMEDMNKQLRRSILTCSILGICVFIVGFMLMLPVIASIRKTIRSMATSINRIADGDLTGRVDYTNRDELGQLSSDMNRMTEKLRDIVSDVRCSAENVAIASRQISVNSADIATGADEVASQTSTIATASEEMSATSNDIAGNCTMAAERSRHSSVSAENGCGVVQETISVMMRIAERVKSSAQTVESLGARSEQVGQIVGTIEEIADQTNLLALNAAIEAARAGEQGRGFAVVADEVRALAERTTKATHEIGKMIKTIQQETRAAVAAMEDGVVEVEKGAESSEKSGVALKDILAQIQDVSMQIDQIATAAEEQTATTSQITDNVHQVTEIVREAAKGATDTAAASSQLAAQAQQLTQLVGRFRIS